MADRYINVNEALRRLNRESLIDEFRRQKISDEVMDLVVRHPENLESLAPVVTDEEVRKRILSTYTFIRGENNLARGALRARTDPDLLASTPAKSPKESRKQVASSNANRIKRTKGA